MDKRKVAVIKPNIGPGGAEIDFIYGDHTTHHSQEPAESPVIKPNIGPGGAEVGIITNDSHTDYEIKNREDSKKD